MKNSRLQRSNVIKAKSSSVSETWFASSGSSTTAMNLVRNKLTPTQICTTQKKTHKMLRRSSISRSVADIPNFLEHQKQGAVLTIHDPMRLHDRSPNGFSASPNLVRRLGSECCRRWKWVCAWEFLRVGDGDSKEVPSLPSLPSSQFVKAGNFAHILGRDSLRSSYSAMFSENVTPFPDSDFAVEWHSYYY